MVTTSVGPLLGLSCNKVHVVKGKWKRVVSWTVPSDNLPLAPPVSWITAAAWASAPACPTCPAASRPTVAIPAFVIFPLPVPLPLPFPVSVSTPVSVSLSVLVLVLLTLTPVSCCAPSSFHLLLALLFLFFLLLLFLLLPPFLTLLYPFCSCSFSLDKLKQIEKRAHFNSSPNLHIYIYG